MPKVPRDKETTTPTKRSRKAAPKTDTVLHAVDGNGAGVASVAVSTEPHNGNHVSNGLEEKIRARAYELYVERGGHGGSPEQDWLRAKEEICGRQRSA